MKSLVFKNAWNLVRTMGVSLSLALTISWADCKAKALQSEINILSNRPFSGPIVIPMECKANTLFRKVNELMPVAIDFRTQQQKNDDACIGLGQMMDFCKSIGL